MKDDYTAPTVPGLQELLDEHEIRDWDVLLVGDGSGSQWEHGCGWACVLVQKITLTPKVFYGGASAGTNYVAELEAYFRPLLWYSEGPGQDLLKRRLRDSPASPLGQVHIITDSQLLVRQANGQAKRDKNRPLWAVLDCIASRGYQFHWHWMRREDTALNRWADRQSRLMRTTLARIGQALQDDLHNPDDLYDERFGLREKA
jgi:ribonuclease HI